MDKIIMSSMTFYGYHGVLPQERELGQQFEVDLELQLDLREPGKTDDPGQTVDYAGVYETVRRVVTGAPSKLIEAVAEQIAGAVLRQFDVQQVLVRVKKPAAPVPGQFGYMAVEIVRSKAKAVAGQ